MTFGCSGVMDDFSARSGWGGSTKTNEVCKGPVSARGVKSGFALAAFERLAVTTVGSSLQRFELRSTSGAGATSRSCY